MTRMITLTNFGYSKLTHNLIKSMEKLNMHNDLEIYCLDENAFDYFSKFHQKTFMQKKGTEGFLEPSSFDKTFSKSLIKEWIHYEKEGWNIITFHKIKLLHDILKAGSDVIFIDGDIVVLKDFRNDLENKSINKDLVIQNDTASEYSLQSLNSGFFLMKSNERTIRLTDYSQIDLSTFTNDQDFINSKKEHLIIYPLQLMLYPNGHVFYDWTVRLGFNFDSYIIHFNYCIGTDKIEYMKKFDYWFMD